MSSCCPSSAWGALKNLEYKEKGIVQRVEDLDIYQVGEGPKCIIWNYDVFGFNASRSRQMCDFLADHGYQVLMPDYYRGQSCDPFNCERAVLFQFLKDNTKWTEVLKVDWEQKVKPFALKNGAEVFGAIGTCWGSYPTIRFSADVDVKAGVSLHPSHSPMMALTGEDEQEVLKEIKCPQMFLPAGDDHANTQIGGLAQQVLGGAIEIVPFPDMAHGWCVRGDMSNPTVERDVKKAFNLVLSFFGKYVRK